VVSALVSLTLTIRTTGTGLGSAIIEYLLGA